MILDEGMIDKIKNAIVFDRIIFKKHALVRMFERKIKSEEIIDSLLAAEIIENYDDDRPYPSCLLLGYTGSRPLHIVLSYDKLNESIYIITIYEPSSELWIKEFKERRKR